MGVVSEVPGASSGYHMNLQPMVRLLAGGIYQNRERMDAQNEAMNERLARIDEHESRFGEKIRKLEALLKKMLGEKEYTLIMDTID